MDKARNPNPVLHPADEVLKSGIYLEADPNFKIIVSWLAACYATAVNRLPTIKDETETRWTQGQSQAFLLINKALTQGRDELEMRHREAEKENLPRNL